MLASCSFPSKAVLFDKRCKRSATNISVKAELAMNDVRNPTLHINGRVNTALNVNTALMPVLPGEHGTAWRHAMDRPLLWQVKALQPMQLKHKIHTPEPGVSFKVCKYRVLGRKQQLITDGLLLL